MPTPLKVVEQQAMQLSAEDRAELADKLLFSVTTPQEHEAAWTAEIERRMAEIDRGEVVSRPWSLVMEELRAKYG